MYASISYSMRQDETFQLAISFSRAKQGPLYTGRGNGAKEEGELTVYRPC